MNRCGYVFWTSGRLPMLVATTKITQSLTLSISANTSIVNGADYVGARWLPWIYTCRVLARSVSHLNLTTHVDHRHRLGRFLASDATSRLQSTARLC